MENTYFKQMQLTTPSVDPDSDYLSRLATCLAGLHADHRILQGVKLDDQTWTITATMSEDVSLLPDPERIELAGMVEHWLSHSFPAWDVSVVTET